jgi:uncharacterized protein
MQSGRTVLIIPGLGNSGPQHWQTLWEASQPKYRRVQQDDWEHPRCVDWTRSIDGAISSAESPVVLVAHSMGCVAAVHWGLSNGANGRVTAALLVAPPDVEADTIPVGPTGFAPCPLSRLPFKSLVVASTNDPFATLERSELFATSWGSELITLESAGHINAASGYGPWPGGAKLLDHLMQ